jgi:plastocyanin
MPKLAIIVLAVVAAGGLAGDAHGAPGTGEIVGTVLVNGKTGAGVVVYLEGDYGLPVPPKAHAVIRQREKQFDPPLTIVVRGTTIDFPNEDKVFHNVFSVSQAARFDFGLYKSGTSKSAEMRHSGAVDVYCNIHPDMIAKVKILDNAYYTIADAQGRFRLPGVPPGDVPLVAWLPSGDQATLTVHVKAGDVADVKLDVVAVAKKHSHTRKDGTPYGRYN